MLALLAAVAGTVTGQDAVKPINPVPPLTDPNKKPDAIKPPPAPPQQGTRPQPAAPGAYYSGTFDGNELGKEWKLVNPDPNRWTMQPKRKSIMMITQSGACPSKDGKNQLILDKELPPEDFEVVVKASVRLQGDGNSISMVLLSDDANYFRVILQQDYYQRVYFQKVFQSQVTGNFSADKTAGEIYLKIARAGNEYTGSYATIEPAKPASADEVQWMGLGTLPWIRFQGKLALCAENFKPQAPEVSAEFYSVVIRKK
jgi:hypothetical protein